MTRSMCVPPERSGVQQLGLDRGEGENVESPLNRGTEDDQGAGALAAEGEGGIG